MIIDHKALPDPAQAEAFHALLASAPSGQKIAVEGCGGLIHAELWSDKTERPHDLLTRLRPSITVGAQIKAGRAA